jgi:hypothetical protein
MVQLATLVTDPILVCRSTCRAFPDREKSQRSPSIRFCHDRPIIVETTNCQNCIRFHIRYWSIQNIGTRHRIRLLRYNLRYRARSSLYTGQIGIPFLRNVQSMYSTMETGTDFDLGQLKGYRSVTTGILILVKCKVLVTNQTHITYQFAQHLFCRPCEKLQKCVPSPSLCMFIACKSPLSMAA